MKELIDQRNIDLWNRIDSIYRVGFEKSRNGEYGCFSRGDEITFVIGKGKLSIGSFTHEMLHIYFRLNDCYLGAALSKTLLNNHKLGKILSPALVEHIGNCFEHLKMFPLYLEMGFEKSQFLYDFNLHKCNSYELKKLKDHYYLNGRVNINLVDQFIGKLVAMICDPNDEINYQTELDEFKQIDSSLFTSIQSGLELWNSVDIESDDVIAMDYRDVVSELEGNLENWYKEKV